MMKRKTIDVAICLIALTALGVACQRVKSQPPLDTSTAATLPVSAPPPTDAWKVVRISDGDTIVVRRGFQEDKIRLCGIDADEKQQERGPQATEYLRSLIGKGDGTVLVTPLEKDRYGRTVAELFVKPRPGTGNQSEEEIFLNGEMVRAGMARHYARYSGSCPNKGVIELSEQMAKQNRAGVWSDPSAVPPWEYRRLQKRG